MLTKTTIIGLTLIMVLIISGITLLLPDFDQAKYSENYFSSYAELSSFLKDRTEERYYYGGIITGARMSGEMAMASTAAGADLGAAEKATEYSATNIQVIGVDEPDIVKTDGKYIYTVNGGKALIVDAYPAESASLVSNISTDGYIQDIFVNNDKVVLFGNYYGGYSIMKKTVGVAVSRYPYWGSSSSFVYVYNVSDKHNPVLTRNITLEGSYLDARMIGDYVYVILNQPIRVLDEGPVLPLYYSGSSENSIKAEDIAYFDSYDTSYSYTFVISLNVKNDFEQENRKVYLLGYSQNMYVSPDNIYITYQKTMSYQARYDRLINEAIIPNVPYDLAVKINEIRGLQNVSYWEKFYQIGNMVEDYSESLGPEEGAKFMSKLEDAVIEVETKIQKDLEKTIIHKIRISNANIEYEAGTEAPGRVLNQFSMDEYNGNFRIATTTGNSWDNTSLNHIYVFDKNLKMIGKLEDLARGEQIYSARFMGDRAYLVTFVRTDPLFVLDMSNPEAPAILGELKMPGFSEYLHPYDNDYLIGFGQDTDENGRRTGQLKVALFDVSDVSNPKIKSTYYIGEKNSWAYSEVSYDHKAFLFSKSKKLMVIPASVNNWNENKYFQGAYVFSVDKENGILLKGTIEHSLANASEEIEYYDWNSAIKRSLYMDDVLYTISDRMIKANNLSDLSFISSVYLESS